MPKALVSHPGDYLRLVICLLALTLTTHCASVGKDVKSAELMRPLSDIRKAVNFSLKGGVKRKSENNRTYFSNFHRPGKDLRLSAYKQKERAQVVITILGDRRPYQVAVLYRIDRLSGGTFVLDHYDKSLAQDYLDKVQNYLSSRPEERDIIDDFRPY